VAPISGAPRTHMSRMAVAASSTLCRSTVTNSCGSRVWSMMQALAPSSPDQIAR
jgi:hypothetical protein